MIYCIKEKTKTGFSAYHKGCGVMACTTGKDMKELLTNMQESLSLAMDKKIKKSEIKFI